MNISSVRRLTRQTLLSLCLVLTQTSLSAQSPNLPDLVLPVMHKAGAILSVKPDRANWIYPLGAPASFRIAFDLSPYPAGGVPIRYRLGPDMREGAELEAIVPAEGLNLHIAAQKVPGFVRCLVSAQLDGRTLTALATAGFAPERIKATQSDPADFDEFWSRQKDALAKVPLDLQLVPAPELSNAKVEAFYLSFQNVGNWAGHSRFYGVLAMPRTSAEHPGPFPALLNVPGAGVRPYRGNLVLAERGFITLQVGIHGIPVNLPPEVYEQLARGALSEYQRNQLDDRDAYYYRRVYLGVLRATEVLADQAKWDGKTLIVSGGSQGGQLSLVAAVLNPKVSAVAVDFPAYSDVSGYWHGSTGGWPGLFRTSASGRMSDTPAEPKLTTSRYYDSVNFARRLTVPGHYTWGFNDMVTPPTSLHAAYNEITAPKRLVIAPDMAHSTSNVQFTLRTNWMLQQAGLTHRLTPHTP
ncbi:acetylxylan esterase [Paucibacter sp. M5-1]|uniref:acetylxylan esterase n=1 Tax=Paucibacter sp. M5-1 TaxID=3015998 RepID=UPI0022B8B765|nr:acetylxylan esterase [Paucibacter sp. M5-1]MCZ7883059.1 acetylxylan esterase [Paucibacter sp. M5-1]